MSDEIKILAGLIEQAKRGNAGLIVITVGTAEALMKQLTVRDQMIKTITKTKDEKRKTKDDCPECNPKI